MRRKIKIAVLAIAGLLALPSLLFYPPADRALGGVFAHSKDGAIIAAYPHRIQDQRARHNGAYVKYGKIPWCLRHAIVSVEDKRFFALSGIDPLAIVRSVFKDLENDHRDHGGSTITEQLARTILEIPHRQPSFLASATSVLRILRATLIIEHDFSKPKILELYLNSVYFGRGATGAGAAAQAYFDKDLQKLSLGECVYLAGLPQAPTRFGDHPWGTASRERYGHVIATMRRNGILTSKQAADLEREQLFSG